MRIEDLFERTGEWLRDAEDTGIVISSRVRLARNLRDVAFPGWAGEEECERVFIHLRDILKGLKELNDPLSVHMADITMLDKEVLFERHLISREHADRGRGSGLIVREDEVVAVMVNEEDHLRLQALYPGLALDQAWQVANAVDSALEKEVSYAFSTRWGYLTACPSNVGSGMRASVMLHLPGLVLMDEMGPIVKGMGKIGLAVRGLWGEGTEAVGNMFQVSNQITLGDREEDIIATLNRIVAEVVDHERNARLRLMEKKESIVRDHVGRAYGILSNAHVLTSKESLDLLSSLRLGIDLGILDDVDRSTVAKLLTQVQPGHLQKLVGKELKPAQRDDARADLVRSSLLKTTRISRNDEQT
ncbi:MAG: protein arginine kinase [Verrucomicrobia bacterium]|nr:protein arginine kinase [Verrucomicrobiota bacterium]